MSKHTQAGQRICPGCDTRAWAPPGVQKGTLCMRCELVRVREINADLLDALKAIVEVIDPAHVGWGGLFDAARAAIAKATGGEP